MHTKDIEYAISMVAHPKAQIIRAKALAQLNSLLNRIVELEAAQHSVHLTAYRRGLALSIFINVVLLAMVLATIGGG